MKDTKIRSKKGLKYIMEVIIMAKDKGMVFVGEVNEYNIFVMDDTVWIAKGNKLVTQENVDGLTDFMDKANEIVVRWGLLPNSFEIIQLFNPEDNFGYGINLSDSHLSEWGGISMTN